MKKAVFITGLIGLSFFTIRLIWETILLIQQLLFNLSNIRISDNNISIENTLSAEFIANLIFVLLVFVISVAFVVLFIRTVLRFYKGKAIKNFVVIMLLIFSSISVLSVIPSQMTVIPKYLLLSELGLLDTILTLYVPMFFSFIASVLMAVSLIIIIVMKRKACKQ